MHRPAQPAVRGVPPYVVADTGTNPWRRYYPGIVLNSEGTEEHHVWPDRRAAAQHLSDRAARMRRSLRPTLVKFGIFGIVMAVMTACLFFIFGQYQTGSTKDYTAVFTDASRLKVGQSVRVGGMRVGTVNSVKLQKDKTALVTFDADPAVR